MQAPVPEPSAPAAAIADMALTEYAPETTLVLARTSVKRPRFPVIDAHAHLGRWLAPDDDWVAADLAGRCDGPWLAADVEALIELLDAHEVAACVNLDGRWGSELEANLERYDRAHPDRFLTFCQLDWRRAADGDDFAEALVASLRRSVQAGARGLKVWKTLGLAFRDAAGELLLPDDERAAPVFAVAGELGLPVLIHTADPRAFFRPVDARNERLEDLGWVSRMLAAYPNLYVDLAARLGDLGRQPRAARRLLCQHPARVLFGTDDLPPNRAGLRGWFRFLESADECYPYTDEVPPPSGRWTVSALELPDEILRAIYADNARRVLRLVERRNGV